MKKALIPRIPVRVVGTRSEGHVEVRKIERQGNDWTLIRTKREWDEHGEDEEYDGRDVFQALVDIRNPEDAKHFLETYGGLGSWPDKDPGATDEEQFRDEVQFSDLMHFQKALTKVSQYPLEKWEQMQTRGSRFERMICSFTPMLSLEITGNVLEGVSREDEWTYLAMSYLFFQKAAGAEYRNCARNTCSRLFRLESQLSKKFCSPECAHNAAVQAYRKRMRGGK